MTKLFQINETTHNGLLKTLEVLKDAKQNILSAKEIIFLINSLEGALVIDELEKEK